MRCINGFTLIETMITVSLIVILGSIGIPIYKGYLEDSKISLAKQNLHSIYLAETNYFYENNTYYFSGITCGDHNVSIITNLFQGQSLIAKDNFNFCIIKIADGYEAVATEINGKNKITIDHLKNITFENNA